MTRFPLTFPDTTTSIFLILAGAVWIIYEVIKRVPPRINEKIKTDEAAKCDRDVGKALDAHKLHASETYATKNDLRELGSDIKERLIRIENFIINGPN